MKHGATGRGAFGARRREGRQFFGRASFSGCPLTPVQVVSSLPLGPLTGEPRPGSGLPAVPFPALLRCLGLAARARFSPPSDTLQHSGTFT